MNSAWSVLLGFAAAAPDRFSEAEWVALSRFSPAVLAGLALVLVASWALSARGVWGAPREVRATLLTLRAVFLGLVFVLLLEPGERLLQKSREPNRVLLFVDTSASMARSDGGEGEETRVQLAARAADDLRASIASREEPFVVETYAFDERTRPLSAEAADALQSGAAAATGRRTSLATALAAATDDGSGRPIGGVVVFSDGADTDPVDASGARLRELAAELDAPIHTVGTFLEVPFVDLAIERVIGDDFAFVRNEVKVEVVLRHRGLASQNVPVTLREDGRPLAVTSTQLLVDTDRTTVELAFTPKAAGKHIYTVEVPVLAGEQIAENNRRDFPLEVIRDRIRVLQVAGRPSWDERFVRRLLKENPSVDLISFFILRTPTDDSRARNDELSLIPFPTRELFTEQLHTFDVVIFQDFDYRPYSMRPYLRNVRDFVLDAGGGFLMMGGERSFSEGEYAGTEIEEILPVRLYAGKGHLNEERFHPRVLDAGAQHPILDLGNLADGDEPFARLPALIGVNLVAGLQGQSEVLLGHPFLNLPSGEPHPVVAVREVGKGRSMALLTDTSWRWGLPHVGQGGRGDAHRRFLANALRWLIKDPDLSRLQVQVMTPSLEPGQTARVDVRTLDKRYAPLGDVDVRLSLVSLDGTADPVEVDAKTGPEGTWTWEIEDPAPGAYRVSATAARGADDLGSDEDALVVVPAAAEALAVEPRPAKLRALSEVGDGRFVFADEVDSLAFTDHEKERVHQQRTEPLWNRAWVLLLLTFVAGLEWYLRRRRGFA